MRSVINCISIIAFVFSAMNTPLNVVAQSVPEFPSNVGNVVKKITVPVSGSTNHCSVGLAFNGTHLFYDRCRDDLIYRISPQTGELIDTFDTNIAELPNALSYDVSRNAIWIGTQKCNSKGMPIYLWDLDDKSVTLRFTIPTTLLNPATNSAFLQLCFADGIAFDANDPENPNDDEIWFSDDVNPNLGVFSTNGTFLRGYDTTTVDPSLNRTSGIAVGGKYLYLGNNGGGDVFRADKSTNPLVQVDQFVSSDSRQEDMECDPVTFAPIEVMWVRTTPQSGQFPDVITAYEIEPNSCNLGGAPIDQDGDGLFDVWERVGIDDNRDGIPDVNLPAMGASPSQPDIFVEIDWMEETGEFAHSHRPNENAIRKIVAAFAAAPGSGIRLHVDVGPDSRDFWTGKLWGDLARGNSLAHEDIVGNLSGTDALQTRWQAIVDQNFQQDERVFRHALFIHRFQAKFLDDTIATIADCNSGYGVSQVFLVSLGGFPNCPDNKTGVGSENQQAGTFMHELGHTLGLQHGGDRKEAEFNNKPNYLSVMNYSFQFSGLIFRGEDGHFDYSRFDLSDLKEGELNESVGFGVDPQLPFDYGTKYKGSAPYLCLLGARDPETGFAIVKNASSAIDWDCDFGIDNGTVRQDINGKGNNNQTLSGYDDWGNLKYKVGNVGALGSPPPITITSAMIVSAPVELSESESLLIPQMSEPRVLLSFAESPYTTTYRGLLNYSITLTNTDLSDAQGIVLSVTLPTNFKYLLGSTTGLTTTDPTEAVSALTWGLLSIASGLTTTLKFQVIAGNSDGAYLTQVSGESANGAIISINNTVTITVKGTRVFLPIVLRNASIVINTTATPINTPTPSATITPKLNTATFTPSPTKTSVPLVTPTPINTPQPAIFALPAGIVNAASSVDVTNGCADFYGSIRSDEEFVPYCNTSISLLEQDWLDHVKKVKIACAQYPNINIKLWEHQNYQGNLWSYTCSGGPIFTPSSSNYSEPNNTTCQAFPITSSVKYISRLDDKDDFFKLNVLVTSTLVVTVTDFTTSGQVQVRKFTGLCDTGQLYSSSSFQGDALATRQIVVANVVPSDVYIRIASTLDVAPNTDYGVIANLVSGSVSTGPFEPNNTACQSAPIVGGTTYQAYPEDSSDWYSFTLASDSNVVLNLTNLNVDTGQYILYKADSCSQVPGTLTPITIQDKSITSYDIGTQQSGVYYLRVAVGSGIQNTSLYSLRIDTTPVTQLSENYSEQSLKTTLTPIPEVTLIP